MFNENLIGTLVVLVALFCPCQIIMSSKLHCIHQIKEEQM